MPKNRDKFQLGGWSISENLHKHIKQLVPEGGTILELGSGAGTGVLARDYRVYSVEHDPDWLGKHPTNYIYAPLRKFKQRNYKAVAWYDWQILREKLPKKYDLLLVDGPPAETESRGAFAFFVPPVEDPELNIFRTDVPIILDDAQRAEEVTMIRKVAGKLKKPYTVYDNHLRKSYAIIMP